MPRSASGSSSLLVRVQVTEPDYPYASAWWPPGHGLGYEHAFVHETKHFLETIAVPAAVEQSAAEAAA